MTIGLGIEDHWLAMPVRGLAAAERHGFYQALLAAVLIFNLYACDLVLAGVPPTFDRLSENVTVIVGNAALLPCFINNLGDHKVGL